MTTPAERGGPGGPWRATNGHVRALVTAALAVLLAAVLNRFDLLVVATPFVLISTWGEVRRPSYRPTTRVDVDCAGVSEGDVVVVSRALRSPGAEVIVDVRPVTAGWRLVGELSRADGDITTTRWSYQALRWGRHRLPEVRGFALSPWWAFGAPLAATSDRYVVVLPRPDAFRPRVSMPHPQGLVGLDRAVRRGTGSELESIHRFQQGDRLRLIHWPVSLRTGALHVSATYADEESHVLVLIDNTTDIRAGSGTEQAASSLDLTMRAAAALVGFHLSRGDRLSVRMLSGHSLGLPATMTGRTWIGPTLHQIAATGRASQPDLRPGRLLSGTSHKAVTLVLSPITHTDVADAVTAQLINRNAILIDTLPARLGEQPTPAAQLAWRITRLQRDTLLADLADRGVPVVTWRGADSLDAVLRAMARRPRLVSR